MEKDWATNTGYLFEIRVGRGRLLVSGLNLSIAADRECAATWLMGEFVNYCLGERFQPKHSFTRAEMESALAKMRERKWQPEYHHTY